MIVVVVLEGVVIALLAVLVAGLLRSHADIIRTLHDRGLTEHVDGTPGRAAAGSASASSVEGPIAVQDGVVAPGPGASKVADITGEQPGGGSRKIAVSGTEHPTLLAFLSSGCITCGAFWTAFGDDSHQADLPSPDTRIVIVTKSIESESPAKVQKLAPERIPTLMSSEAWNQYKVPGSPYFVLVDGPSGTVIGEGSGTSWSQVGGLLRSSLADRGVMLPGANRPIRHDDGPAREARADTELLAAGVHPGHDSLYPTSLPQVDDVIDDGS